ncbi:MAG: class I SAM-dependent methyltransferase [Bacteriovoracaceae bacterium]|nr:class I SAM-dependent methyltransferase [Bacteriovoracaceae bacterium]
MDKIILEHYKKLSVEWGLQGQMSMQDQVIRERETKFLIEQTKHCLRLLGVAPEQAQILDTGCGNGYLLQALWEELAGAQMTGLEFVPELVHLAQSRNLPGIKIEHSDMRVAQEHKAHIVISERSVVNLLTWEEQKLALTQISQWVRPGGFYLMVESFHEPWIKLNDARRENNLPEIPVSPHNRYLREACLETLAKLGLREVEGIEPKNALSSHFFLSRIFQHLLKSDSRPGLEKIWSALAEGLKDNFGDFSPILFRVFRKDSL